MARGHKGPVTGRLVLVVGPSGAGKDSILRYAMTKFSGDDRVVFPKRCITRTGDAEAEDHESVDVVAFDAMSRHGEFALMWDAHGLKYGIRRSIDDCLNRQGIVVVNVSRTILKDVADLYPQALVVEISASDETRARRIAARGRERPDDILQRVSRKTPAIPAGLQSHRVENDGNLSDAGEIFCDLICALLSNSQRRF
jgi:ribose 1,5-bisphosphokinase